MPIRQGLANGFRGNRVLAREVGNGARHALDTTRGPGGKAKSIHRPAQECIGLGSRAQGLIEIRVAEIAVARPAPGDLSVSSKPDPLSDVRTGFFSGGPGEVTPTLAWYRDVEIDAVEQWA